MKECMDFDSLHRRLKKIIGQVQAIDRMIEEDIPCEDILTQVNASKSALHKVGEIILEGHLNHCVREGIEHGDADRVIESFAKAVDNFSKIRRVSRRFLQFSSYARRFYKSIIPIGGIGILMGRTKALYGKYCDAGSNPIVLIVSAAAMALSCLWGDPPADPAWIPTVLCGFPIIAEAAIALVTRLDIKADLLVSIAIIASIAVDELFAAGTVALIMQVGGYVEDRTVAKARRGMEHLSELKPATARVKRGDGYEAVPAEDVKVGDTLRVLAGEIIPADGRIVSGHASVDQSIMMGESLPVDKAEGDEVSGGAVSRFGAFDMIADRIGDDTAIQRMIGLIESADPGRAKVVRAADRWATWIVAAALAAAALTYVVTRDMARSVTILVVFCPCSFILATPTAVVAAIGNAARYGALVREGDALERLATVDSVVFDKTGTLTTGTLDVVRVIPVSDLGEEGILRHAASAEAMSEHPLGKSVVANCTGARKLDLLPFGSFEMIPGQGVVANVDGKRTAVGNAAMLNSMGLDSSDAKAAAEREEAEGRTVVYVAVDGKLEGAISLADTIRSESPEVVKGIREQGVGAIIVTGDSRGAAEHVTRTVGASDVVYDSLPEDKLRIVRNIEKGGKPVCMIGDGVNDAAALKAARVGVAMGLGSDIARESSDIVLSRDGITSFPHLLALAKRTMRTIHANLAIALSVNSVALVLAMFGEIDPIAGAFIHNGGSVLVMAISSLLLTWKGRYAAGLTPAAAPSPA